MEELDKARLRGIANEQYNNLTRQIEESEEMWKNKDNHAKIIGYLQGALKGALIINEILLKNLEK